MKPPKGLLEAVLHDAMQSGPDGKMPNMGELFTALVCDIRNLTLDIQDLQERVDKLSKKNPSQSERG